MSVSGAENYQALAADLRELHTQYKDILPDFAILQRMMPFSSKELQAVGLQYVETVRTKRPSGFTFANSGTGPYDLNAARSGKTERAVIQANNVHLIEVLDRETMYRGQGEGAVKEVTSLVFEGMMEACRNWEEINLLYGQQELAVIDSGGVTTVTATISKASWGPALWIGAENMPVDIFDTNGTTFRGTFTIASVTPELRQIVFDTSLAAASVVAGDKLYRSGTHSVMGGAAVENEAAGVAKIVKNTGTMFNIDASKYALWKGTKFDNGSAAMTVGSCIRLSSLAVVKGTRSGSVLLTPVDSWADLAIDETAFRRWQDFEGGKKIGPDALQFVGAAGVMAIKPHPMVKRGEPLLINIQASEKESVSDWKRIGAKDWTFIPGPGNDILHYLPTQSGVQVELYQNKALLCDPPGRSGYIANVVDTAGY